MQQHKVKQLMWQSASYPDMLSNVLLINITHYFLFVTFPNIDQHVSIWVLCKFEGSIIESRICLWQLLYKLKRDDKWETTQQICNQKKRCEWVIKSGITSSSPPYCSSRALFTSSLVTRSSSNLYLEKSG